MTEPERSTPWWLQDDQDAPGPERLRVRWWLLVLAVVGLIAFAAFFVYIGTVGVRA